MAVQAKRRIREYEILEQVGRGGMGAVFKARHIYLNKIRAIKIIHAALALETEFSDRFIREARILSELNHPNLVRLYEFGTLDEGTFFMVMEFVHGESLLQRIRKKGKLSIEEAVRITRDAAIGLHSAHQLGIIHRDVSPDNILLVRDQHGEEIVKVIDFGIAKALVESQKFTGTHTFIGKPEYCSPEQTGYLENSTVDHRSDIYSLAVCFYQMISGKLPFNCSTPIAYLLKHANDPPLPISAHFHPGETPDELERVLAKALTKNPEQRYRSMLEFAEDLRNVESAIRQLDHTLTLQNPTQKFQEFFDLGKKSYDQLEWLEAIHWWNKASAISSDPTLQGWIASAQERLQLEREVRTALSRELEECEMEVYQGNTYRASQMLDHVEQSLTPDFNVEDLQTRAATLREKLVTPAPPKSAPTSHAVLVAAVISFFVFLAIGGTALYLVPRFTSERRNAERLAIAEEVQSLTEENRFREARKKLLLLEEKGMDPSDPKYRRLETALEQREQDRAKSLYLEAEAAFNSANIAIAEKKLTELEALKISSLAPQISALKERIRKYSDYATVAEKTRTPLMQEILSRNVDRARQIIEEGTGINAADGNGYTVLMYAVWKTPEVVLDLLKNGANVNAKDNRSVTALHVACDIGHLQSVYSLVEFGAELDVRNITGATPLIIAATRGHTDIARTLMREGADVSITTPNGYDALKTAEYYNHHEIADLIRHHKDPLNQGTFVLRPTNPQ